MSFISSDVQFAELMNQLRHLGALRFVMMGICAAFTIGLVTAHYSLSAQCSVQPMARFFNVRSIGLIMVVLFVFFEMWASWHYTRFANRAVALEGNEGAIFKGRQVRLLGPVTLMSLVVYALLLVVWWTL